MESLRPGPRGASAATVIARPHAAGTGEVRVRRRVKKYDEPGADADDSGLHGLSGRSCGPEACPGVKLVAKQVSSQPRKAWQQPALPWAQDVVRQAGWRRQTSNSHARQGGPGRDGALPSRPMVRDKKCGGPWRLCQRRAGSSATCGHGQRRKGARARKKLRRTWSRLRHCCAQRTAERRVCGVERPKL